MQSILGRLLGSMAAFLICLLVMSIVCVCTWDAFVNGKIYYCTDGGSLDFICVGDWVHHPEPVARVVPRSMSEPDEIKMGWNVPALWRLWIAFVGASFFVSALAAGIAWRNMSPDKSFQADGS